MNLSITITRRETLWGWGYLLFSLFVFPFAMGLISSLLAEPLSASAVNLIYFFLNFVCVVAIFHRFLWTSVKALVAQPWRSLLFAALGIGIYYLASILITSIIIGIDPFFSNVNDENIMQMTQEYTLLLSFATIWLVPVAEEVFYRGLFFQGLRKKNRILAYAVSTAAFAMIHVMGYIGYYDWLTLCLCFLQYVPAGIVLAWVYEKTDTIAAPILMHITINQIGMSAMR